MQAASVSHKDTPSPLSSRSEWPQFSVRGDVWMHCPDYGAPAREVLFVAREVPDSPDLSNWIKRAVRTIRGTISENDVEDEDLIGFSLTAWGLEEKQRVVVLGMRRKEKLQTNDMTEALKGIIRDRPTFFRNGPLVAKVKYIKRNGQRQVADEEKFNKKCHKNKGIITVQATPSPVHYLSRALVLSKAWMEKNQSTKQLELYNKRNRTKPNLLAREARALRKEAKVGVKDQLDTAMRRFDNYYSKQFTITVFLGLDGKQVMYESRALHLPGKRHMDIVTDGRKFHVVASVSRAFSRLYCRLCRVPYRVESEHECLERCRHCRQIGVCLPESKIRCKICNRSFVNNRCFQRHKEQYSASKSVCDLVRMCNVCREWYSVEGSKKKHECAERFCKSCRAKRPANHTCPMARKVNDDSANRAHTAKRRRLETLTSVLEPSQDRNATAVSRGYADECSGSRSATVSPSSGAAPHPAPSAAPTPSAARPANSNPPAGCSKTSSQYRPYSKEDKVAMAVYNATSKALTEIIPLITDAVTSATLNAIQ